MHRELRGASRLGLEAPGWPRVQRGGSGSAAGPGRRSRTSSAMPGGIEVHRPPRSRGSVVHAELLAVAARQSGPGSPPRFRGSVVHAGWGQGNRWFSAARGLPGGRGPLRPPGWFDAGGVPHRRRFTPALAGFFLAVAALLAGLCSRFRPHGPRYIPHTRAGRSKCSPGTSCAGVHPVCAGPVAGGEDPGSPFIARRWSAGVCRSPRHKFLRMIGPRSALRRLRGRPRRPPRALGRGRRPSPG